MKASKTENRFGTGFLQPKFGFQETSINIPVYVVLWLCPGVVVVDDVARCLLPALLNFLEVKHKEGLAEATRVFGNLTRERDIRDFLVQNKSMQLNQISCKCQGHLTNIITG